MEFDFELPVQTGSESFPKSPPEIYIFGLKFILDIFTAKGP